MSDDLTGDMSDQPGLLDMGAGEDQRPPAVAPSSSGYRVLARKYRPTTFADLIGQEAMVRTITNAFAAGRIPQAWMLTGVRGVGKTTTARILARGLNYQTSAGGGGPTVDLGEPGLHCQQIIEGRHIDVIEIDAASNTSVDNIRQINEAVRYAPVSARYKVYIVDEVHMLSSGAFNAFLKTLEEPPPHAKFIFATTEIRKVPVTILSRCQRFDLRRVEAGVLVEHLRKICAAEAVAAEDQALQAIARAAEGSVRDAMSLLDQAIAHGAGRVDAQGVQAMLGLADRARIIDLFAFVVSGDLPGALDALKALYDIGADPGAVLNELAEFTHLVTRIKVTPQAARDPLLTEIEATRGAALAAQMSMRALSRLWQMLIKGIGEVRDSGRPLAAAEMVLVRLAHAADLPTPDEALRLLAHGSGAGASGTLGSGGTGAGSGPGPGGVRSALARASQPAAARLQSVPAARELVQMPSARASAEPLAPRPAVDEVRVASLEDIMALAARHRDVRLQAAIQRDVRLVRLEPGRLDFALAETGDRTLAQELSRKLKEWTGRTWMVAISAEAPGRQTLRERQQQEARERRDTAAAHPAVRALMTAFPGARIVDVRGRASGDDSLGENHPGEVDAGLAASLESGEGLHDPGLDAPDDDDDGLDTLTI